MIGHDDTAERRSSFGRDIQFGQREFPRTLGTGMVNEQIEMLDLSTLPQGSGISERGARGRTAVPAGRVFCLRLRGRHLLRKHHGAGPGVFTQDGGAP